MGIAKETTNGVIWSSFSRFFQLIVQFLLITILSRLLCPEDFASIGVLTVFTILSELLIDSGFSQALIRETTVDSEDLSSVFFFNIGIGILIYVLLFFSSSYIAVFFRIQELERISKILFLNIIFNSLSIVPRTILARDMNFKKIAISSVCSLLISAFVGITTAYYGLGVYSLVFQALAHSFFSMLFLFVAAKWIPKCVFIWGKIKRLLGFSINLLISGLITQIFNNLFTILIGRYYPQKTLGYYTQAKKIEEIPSLSITTIIQNVTYSSMSKVKDDIGLLKKAYLKVLLMNIYIVFPIMCLCYVSCNSFIPILLGEKWMPIIPYFKLLCIYGALLPLFSVNINILKVKGYGKKVLEQEIVRRTLMIAFVLLTIKSGIIYMLIGWIISMVLSIIYSFVQCGKPIHYSLLDQLKDILPYIIIAVVCAGITFFINYFPFHIIVKLLLQIILYFLLYVGLSRVLKLSSYFELISIIQKIIQKKYPHMHLYGK